MLCVLTGDRMGNPLEFSVTRGQDDISAVESNKKDFVLD